MIEQKMDIYVGNLPYEIEEQNLWDAFGEYGEVEKIKMIVDHETGRPKGFAFVTMVDTAAGRTAIKSLDGAELGGRPVRVNEARPKDAGGAGAGAGGYGGGRGAPRRGGHSFRR